MQHIINEHKRLDLKIELMASYVIIPHGGFYKKYEIYNIICLIENVSTENSLSYYKINICFNFFRNQSLLVFNLGCLKIKSKPQSIDDYSIQLMQKKGASQYEVLQELVSRSYDRYFIELENAQVK